MKSDRLSDPLAAIEPYSLMPSLIKLIWWLDKLIRGHPQPPEPKMEMQNMIQVCSREQIQSDLGLLVMDGLS